MATNLMSATWSLSEQRFPRTLPIEEQLRFLIRYAILAPSTRNSQPWRFRVEGNAVLLLADPDRWLPVADPSRRELHLSLGCALENLLVAAGCVGYQHALRYFPEAGDPDLAAAVTFTPAPRSASAPPRVVGLETLRLRHTNRWPFLTRAVAPEVLAGLRAIPGGPGIRLSLSAAAADQRVTDVLNVRAMGNLFGSAEYRGELARVMGQGQLGGSWVGNQVARVALSHLNLARLLARQDSGSIRSAPLIGVIGSLADAPADQVRCGRLLERLWLRATAQGLALQPISAPLEVPSIREELAAAFPDAPPWPQQLVCLGYPSTRGSHHSPRRDLEEVVSAGQNGRAPHAP